MSRAFLSALRARGAGMAAALLAAFLAAACTSLQFRTAAPEPAAPAGPAGPAPVSGEAIGSGEVRVALLLPRSATGNAASTATAFRNAAELAMRDFPNTGIQVIVYDTKGTPQGAQTAATAALSEGAEIILGPIFSGEVAAVAPQARGAGVPVVAFSSDASVAGPGVYLLSFQTGDYVRRIVSYAAQKGSRAFAALLPNDAYGSVAEASFREAVAAAGGQLVTVERYQADAADIQAKAAAVAAASSRFNALLIPDRGEAVAALAPALAGAGITPDRIRFLGSGLWEDDPRILNNPALAGAWFPAPSRQGFEAFAQRYRAAYGAEPPRNATLAYDGTVLAAGLVRQFGAERFSQSVLTNPNGFAGIDGVFRFLPGGTTERRLAVYEVTGSGVRVIEPAARSFASGS